MKNDKPLKASATVWAFCLLLLGSLAMLPLAGCASDGVGEEIGESVDDAVDEVGEAVEDA